MVGSDNDYDTTTLLLFFFVFFFLCLRQFQGLILVLQIDFHKLKSHKTFVKFHKLLKAPVENLHYFFPWLTVDFPDFPVKVAHSPEQNETSVAISLPLIFSDMKVPI